MSLTPLQRRKKFLENEFREGRLSRRDFDKALSQEGLNTRTREQQRAYTYAKPGEQIPVSGNIVVTSGEKEYKGQVVDTPTGTKVIAIRTVSKEEQQFNEKERAIREAKERLRPSGMSIQEYRVRQGYAKPSEKLRL